MRGKERVALGGNGKWILRGCEFLQESKKRESEDGERLGLKSAI